MNHSLRDTSASQAVAVSEDGLRIALSIAAMPENVCSYLQFRMGQEAAPGSCTLDDKLAGGCCVAVGTHRRTFELSRFLDSLAQQTRSPYELVIIDSSPDDQTEQMLRNRTGLPELASRVVYVRVMGPLCGLTRQRNYAMRWVTRDLIAFFDDDVVLSPECLQEMESVHQSGGGSIAGVAAFIGNQQQPPSALWRVRRLLGIVPSLRPGSYARGGMPVSWNFLPENSDVTEGDWLCGVSMMWRTAVAPRCDSARSLPATVTVRTWTSVCGCRLSVG